jgi:hypothetical protein
LRIEACEFWNAEYKYFNKLHPHLQYLKYRQVNAILRFLIDQEA